MSPADIQGPQFGGTERALPANLISSRLKKSFFELKLYKIDTRICRFTVYGRQKSQETCRRMLPFTEQCTKESLRLAEECSHLQNNAPKNPF